MDCPRCNNATMSFDWRYGTMMCPQCEFRLYEDSAQSPAPTNQQADDALLNRLATRVKQPDAATSAAMVAALGALEEQLSAQDEQPPIAFKPPIHFDTDTVPGHIGEYNQVRMRGRLATVLHTMARGDQDEIKKALLDVLKISDQHADTWMVLASMADTADEQRRCLEHVLACKPADPVTMRLLAKLDGTWYDDNETIPAQGDEKLEPDQLAVIRQACPQCGGQLSYDELSREVNCRFCGYFVVDADDLDRSDRHKTILEGNVKRKRTSKVWNIGERWLHCQECGARTTISRQSLTSTCRFCQSEHIIQESVEHPYEQPDLIVPFILNEDEVHAAIEHHMRTGIRRLTRYFMDAIDRIEVQGAYLPFWIFDADMVVSWSWSKSGSSGKNTVLLSDTPFLAAKQPDAKLVRQTEPYDLRKGVDYDPRLLVKYPAELYTIDIPQASIDVRTRLSRDAVRKEKPALYARKPVTLTQEDDPGSLSTSASTQFLTYRFALLPVWLGVLIEEDGDTKQVIVNGQTGKVSVGPLRKAKKRG